MPENYIPFARVAAIFNIPAGDWLSRVMTDGHLFQCLAHVAKQDTTHEPEGVGAALEQLTKDARNGKGDYNQRGLALAFGLKGTESEEEIITYLRGICHELNPQIEEAKALWQRVALIGLSANNHSPDVEFGHERVAEKQRDHAHVVALNAAVASYQRKKGRNFQAAFNAVMQPRKISDSIC